MRRGDRRRPWSVEDQTGPEEEEEERSRADDRQRSKAANKQRGVQCGPACPSALRDVQPETVPHTLHGRAVPQACSGHSGDSGCLRNRVLGVDRRTFDTEFSTNWRETAYSGKIPDSLPPYDVSQAISRRCASPVVLHHLLSTSAFFSLGASLARRPLVQQRLGGRPLRLLPGGDVGARAALDLRVQPRPVPQHKQQLKPHKQRRQDQALRSREERGRRSCAAGPGAAPAGAGRRATAAAWGCKVLAWKNESSSAGLRPSATMCPRKTWTTHESTCRPAAHAHACGSARAALARPHIGAATSAAQLSPAKGSSRT